MDPVLVVALVVGAVAPVVVGAAIVLMGMPRGAEGGWSMTVALGKGIALGIFMGASVSVFLVALILAGAWWLERR